MLVCQWMEGCLEMRLERSLGAHQICSFSVMDGTFALHGTLGSQYELQSQASFHINLVA